VTDLAAHYNADTAGAQVDPHFVLLDRANDAFYDIACLELFDFAASKQLVHSYVSSF
jgi:hypothetical protein